MSELTPYICVSDGRAAMAWYRDVLGADVVYEPIVMPDGRIGHVELAIDGARSSTSRSTSAAPGGGREGHAWRRPRTTKNAPSAITTSTPTTLSSTGTSDEPSFATAVAADAEALAAVLVAGVAGVVLVGGVAAAVEPSRPELAWNEMVPVTG